MWYVQLIGKRMPSGISKESKHFHMKGQGIPIVPLKSYDYILGWMNSCDAVIFRIRQCQQSLMVERNVLCPRTLFIYGFCEYYRDGYRANDFVFNCFGKVSKVVGIWKMILNGLTWYCFSSLIISVCCLVSLNCFHRIY